MKMIACSNIVFLTIFALISGCAAGPDFTRPDAPKGADYAPQALPEESHSAPVHGGEPQRFSKGSDIPFDWWKSFNSPQLDSLVQRAIQFNPTIEAAQAALRQANEMVYAQQGLFFPTLSASYGFERQQLAGNSGGNSPGIQGNGSIISTTSGTPASQGGSAPYNAPVTYNFHTAQLNVGYVPDVFGLNRREVESLKAQAEYERFQYEAAYMTLASNVVAAAIQEASVRSQIEATKQIIDLNAHSLKILRDQFKSGYAMRIDVAAQESALAQAEQLLAPLEKQYEQTRDLIRALSGRLPNEDIEETFEFSSLQLPQSLPLSLPSKIIEQRPDVRSAEEQLHAANAQVGVAIANWLPQISITGAYGGEASVFEQMFQPGGPFWNLIGSVSQTLFDGNSLLHRKRAAEQALHQAAAQYRSTVIAAYQNIADTLHALLSDADSLAAAVKAEEAAKVTLDLTRRQQEAGYVNSLILLSAQLSYQQALVTRVQAQTNRFNDTVALFEALGGGWWNREETKIEKAAQNSRDR
jgi:NodT family efflux transporter outer membrane factor (OMF) lipoprotein